MKYTFTALIAAVFLISWAKSENSSGPFCSSTDLTRFPYEGDCTKFWECYEGTRYLMDCPTGLEFSAAQSRCNTPSVANCNPDATIVYPTVPHSTESTPTSVDPTTVFSTYPYSTESTPSSNETTSPTFPQSTESTPSPAPTEDPDPIPECPFPSDELIYFPVANNCSKYWECFQGNRYLMSCPAGLYWNTLANYCDYPANVECNRGSTTSSSTTTTTPEVTTPEWECPLPGNVMTFYPHPTECNKYYMCDRGYKSLMTCPIGLYWNNEDHSCDRKENVDCDRVGTTTTTPASPTTAKPACVDQPDGTFLPDPDDCSSFYECVGGQVIEEQCPNGLHWNQNALTCDYPENVSCNAFIKMISRN